MTKKDFLYLGIIIVLALSLGFSLRSCQNNKTQYNTNIEALTDTITYIKSKNNDLIATKTIYEANIKDLQSLNNELYEDIKNMNVKNPETVIKYVGAIDNKSNDTTYIIKNDTIYKGFSKSFDFSNKWRTFNGSLDYIPDSLKFNINNDIVYFDYTVIVDDDNKLYIKSSNPYVKYEEMTGLTLPKQKQKRFGIGPHIGYGLDLSNMKFSPYIGIGLQYNLISF